MEVLLFQIAIFFVLLFSGYLSKRFLSIVAFLIIGFTLIAVETLSLMVFQFVTIALSLYFLTNKIDNSADYDSGNYFVPSTKDKDSIELVFKVLVYIFLVIVMVYQSPFFLKILINDSGLDSISKVKLFDVILGIVWFIIASIMPLFILFYFLFKIYDYCRELISRI